jgi:hypothetical protein
MRGYGQRKGKPKLGWADRTGASLRSAGQPKGGCPHMVSCGFTWFWSASCGPVWPSVQSRRDGGATMSRDAGEPLFGFA